MVRLLVPFAKLAIMSGALFMVGCGRLCAGGTPVEEITCSEQGAATFSSAAIPGGPTAMYFESAQTSIEGDGFGFFFVDYLDLQISSSFPNGATSYSLPSPVVTVQASIELPSTDYMFEELRVVSGTIAVATVNPNVLDASGSLILDDDAGRTFNVTDLTVHVTCAYDETVCR